MNILTAIELHEHAAVLETEREKRNKTVRLALWQFLLAVTMLAHQAWLMTDAIWRTLVRLFVTRRHLLEWVPAAQAGYGVDPKLRAFYGHLRWGVVLAVVAGALFVAFKPGAWPVAAPLVLLWALSPVFAWRISVPVKLAEGRRLSRSSARR